MGDVVRLRPRALCTVLGCARPATAAVEVVDMETRTFLGRKPYCKKHLPDELHEAIVIALTEEG